MLPRPLLAPLLVGVVFAFLSGGVSALDSSVQNTIETRVFVDYKAMERWIARTSSSDAEVRMTEFIKGAFAGLNKIFETLITSGINLDARIVSIEYINEPIATNVYNHNRTDVDLVLDGFGDWLATKSYAAVDHNLLVTGWDLSNGTVTNIAGVAKVGAMCGTSSLSAVEAKFYGSFVQTLAHEIGHSLNVSHDGNRNTCHNDSHNVMDPSGSGNSTKNFEFSTCSITQMMSFLDDLHTSGSCLSASKTNTDPVVSPQLGEIYSPDTICQMAVHSNSYFARWYYGEGGFFDYTNICTAIWCHKSGPDANGYTTYYPARGTDGFPCGSGKRCSLGFCVSSTTVPATVSDTCPYGDTPSHAGVNGGGSCQQREANGDATYCYLSGKRVCCDSCGRAKTSNPDCEYGDHTDCSFLIPNAISLCYDHADYWCCGTCQQHKKNISGCEYGDHADCSRAIERNYHCYGLEYWCCGTCQQYDLNWDVPNCQFGDHSSGCGDASTYKCKRYGTKECCQTCSGSTIYP